MNPVAMSERNRCRASTRACVLQVTIDTHEAARAIRRTVGVNGAHAEMMMQCRPLGKRTGVLSGLGGEKQDALLTRGKKAF